MSVPPVFWRNKGVDIKTHDIVDYLVRPDQHAPNHAVVTVQCAYQTTITIDGHGRAVLDGGAPAPSSYWDFFEENENRTPRRSPSTSSNVYNQLTGGLIINQSGPVTVIADGKSSVAPNGKLPAASILDAKGITLGKEDRVSVEKGRQDDHSARPPRDAW